jgi:putative FmdB family regulatory protein
MPIYEYRCEACGHQQEFLQKVSDPTLTVCPACGKATFVKMLTAAGFQLKGSGWYATDFKNKSAPPAAKTEGKSGSGEKTSGEAKPESTKSESAKSEGTKSEGAKSEGTSSSTPSSGSAASS